MTSIFDGMAGILNQVFGAPVAWTPSGGSTSTIRGVFRDTPVRVPTEDGGEVVTVTPTIEVQKPAADQIRRGDTIIPGNGKSYTVLAPFAKGSPAGDAFVIFELETLQ